MRTRIMLLSALYVYLLAALGTGCAQQSYDAQSRVSQSPTAGTVSVWTLAISNAAREHYRLALLAHKAHRDEECDREIVKALAKTPRFPEVLLLRAAREINSHEYEDAIRDAQAALQFDPNLAWSPVALAEAYNGLKRYRDALLMLENLHGSISESWQAKYERARAEVGLGHAPDALYWSAQTLAVVPKSFLDAHLLYANALQLSERWREAASELRLYLASSGPQARHDEVLSALAFVEERARVDTPENAAAR